jgi:hypothetical protein
MLHSGRIMIQHPFSEIVKNNFACEGETAIYTFRGRKLKRQLRIRMKIEENRA